MQANLDDVRSDPLYGRARDLVPMARVIAIQLSSDPRAGEAACFKSINDDDKQWWDFFVTVAGVFVALTGLQAIEPARAERLANVVVGDLETRFPKRGREGLADCQTFFNKMHNVVLESAADPERGFAASDTIGAWIVWSLLDRSPESEAERQMVRVLGGIVARPISTWFDE